MLKNCEWVVSNGCGCNWKTGLWLVAVHLMSWVVRPILSQPCSWDRLIVYTCTCMWVMEPSNSLWHFLRPLLCSYVSVNAVIRVQLTGKSCPVKSLVQLSLCTSHTLTCHCCWWWALEGGGEGWGSCGTGGIIYRRKLFPGCLLIRQHQK